MPIRPSTRFALVLALALSACRNAEAPDASALAADSTPTVSADPTAPDLLPQPEGSSASVPVDLAAGTIGGIDFDAPVDALVRQLGDEAVREEETAVEGEARTVFVFTVEGGEVRRNGALVQYADPRFRTADGLGVGVPVSDFGARYGHSN
ncbi:MAG TPA: hypothetical protein VD948_07350, partial [Rhodothermales bacterium]|nr:hypothetical protein [Rhodothermales bacterium]